MYEIPVSVITWYLALAITLFLSVLILHLIYELYQQKYHSFTSDLWFSVWNRNYMSQIDEKCFIWRYKLQAREIVENLKKPQNSSNFFYFSGRYVRKARFSNGEDQLCALGLSAAIKNHKDTF